MIKSIYTINCHSLNSGILNSVLKKGRKIIPTRNLNNHKYNNNYYTRKINYQRYYTSLNAKNGSPVYSKSVYIKTYCIYGFGLSFLLVPFIIEHYFEKTKNLFLSDEDILDFERSRRNMEQRINYERAFRDANLKEDPPKTILESIHHKLYILWRIGKLTFIFFPVIFLSPFAYMFDFIKPLWWMLLRNSLEKAGGCWIKLGQWASTRPDLFPEDVIEQLIGFQNQCPAHSIEYTKSLIRKNYDGELEDIFEEFSPEPIASGAIAQVHKAKLKINGKEVAVKVMHPGIKRQIIVDLHLMYSVARLISMIPTTEWMSLDEALEQFSITMAGQISMRNEARNLMRFGRDFSEDDNVVFPKVIENMTTDEVLIETFEHGQSLSSYIKSNKNLEEHKILARIGLRSFLKMILMHNFIHADLHPGNILVRKNPITDKLQLVLLDTGLISELSDTDWIHFKQLFKCIVQGDGKGGGRLMVEHARQTNISEEDKEKFVAEMDKLFHEMRTRKISEIDIGTFLHNLLNTVRKYRVKIESNFATLCIATVILEGIGRQLDPEINILDQSIPLLIWSEKATVDDRMVFLRERLKDEFEIEDKNVSIWKRLANILRPVISSFTDKIIS